MDEHDASITKSPPVAPKVPLPTPTKFDVQKFIAHLTEKWKGRPCPMCQTGNWQVNDKVFELREFLGGALMLGNNAILAVIPVTCGNCGNTILINAISTGMISQPKTEGQ